jgi:hypothetical protein
MAKIENSPLEMCCPRSTWHNVDLVQSRVYNSVTVPGWTLLCLQNYWDSELCRTKENDKHLVMTIPTFQRTGVCKNAGEGRKASGCIETSLRNWKRKPDRPSYRLQPWQFSSKILLPLENTWIDLQESETFQIMYSLPPTKHAGGL